MHVGRRTAGAILGFALLFSFAGCDGGPPGSDPGSCEGAPAGPSGGAATDRAVLCALDEAGAPIAGAEVAIGGAPAGVTDARGRVEVDLAPGSAIELAAAGRVPHTLLGVGSRRYGVVLASATPRTRTITGTVSGINALPRPPDGFRRVVEVRAASRFTPLGLAEGIAVGAPVDCTLAGDECAFTLEVEEGVEHVGATVVDATSAFADRRVAAFAFGAIVDGAASFAIPGRDGGLFAVELDAGLDVVVGVPGARVGDDVLLFGSPTATDLVPVPGEALGGTAWLAVIYAGATDELHAGVVVEPGANASAPSAPGVRIGGMALTLPAGRLSTISVARAGVERWRATVLDGRTTVSVPSADADRVAVLVHGPAGGHTPDAIRTVEAVSVLPVIR
ncbi:MAG: hypothetical protein KF729_24460 [Sandaracinaceae bacterium]|nr:hypothetical protein [Sandaracinaceae bacterium]